MLSLNKSLLLSLSFLFLIGCKQPNVLYVNNDGNIPLPTKAVNLVDEGNGWYTFDFGSNKLLIYGYYGRAYSFNVGPSDEVQKNLDELGKAIEEGIRQNQARPFRPLDDPAPRPPRDDKDRSI